MPFGRSYDGMTKEMSAILDALGSIAPAKRTIAGSAVDIAYDDWPVILTDGTPVTCRSLEFSSDNEGGNVVVHPVGNPDGENYTIEVAAGAGSYSKVEFDAIVKTGTTCAFTYCDLMV